MGQIALGFRSLLIKLAVFFVMAALLAWALGGTLWPRAETVDRVPVDFGGCQWFWRLTAGGREHQQTWSMMVRCAEGHPEPVAGPLWEDVAGPVIAEEAIWFAGRRPADERWRLMKAVHLGDVETFELPDRLAVERQLARLAAGLPLQSAESIARQRAVVLDPPATEEE
jgi:hypothetical protein